MSIMRINSFLSGKWVPPGSGSRDICSAITGEKIAVVGNTDLDYISMLDFARKICGPALRKLTFHDRARMLKALALYLNEYKEALYEISFNTGATQKDNFFDIDGGIGTLFVYASKGRRELPDSQVYLDGEIERISKNGTFLGQHICTPLTGVAIHINAFNFPVWGMLEKFSQTFLAGMPSIVKPATASSYVAERCVRLIVESNIFPQGALQLVSGDLGETLNNLTHQDVISFTGSAETAKLIRSNPHLADNSIRFSAEQDSLNASILGPDVKPDSLEFDLFIKEITRDIITKSGQKCTAIRRILAPSNQTDALINELKSKLAEVKIGDPRLKNTNMGALISKEQKQDVLEKISIIEQESECVFGNVSDFELNGDSVKRDAFIPPLLFHCNSPKNSSRIHDTEAFGPVSTILSYNDIDEAVELANKGQGSLVTSLITKDSEIARHVVYNTGVFNGRIYINNRESMKESTGHGSPLPHMIHGGPGRAGGSEELGGIRGVLYYMQRTAIQASPNMLTSICNQWVPGSQEIHTETHPFTHRFNELNIGETIHSKSRLVTSHDIEHFADFTGDTFYAHMDEKAAKNNPFFSGRVAHGYLLLSFAAGLFVMPDPGPVLANVGLDKLRFLKPVSPGDKIKVQLTVLSKKKRNEDYGEVRWYVNLTNQDDESVAEYELLTMNAF